MPILSYTPHRPVQFYIIRESPKRTLALYRRAPDRLHQIKKEKKIKKNNSRKWETRNAYAIKEGKTLSTRGDETIEFPEGYDYVRKIVTQDNM